MLDELVVLVAGEVFDVGGVAGDEIVDADHSMSLGEKMIREMGTKETGAAGNDRSRTRRRHGRVF